MDRSSQTAREPDPANPLCPDPELLAAWVDQGLEATERTRIDTHLAGCDDCRLLVARVIEFQHATAEEAGAQAGANAPAEPLRVADDKRPAAVLPFTRRLTRWRVAAFATAAAALLLAVQARPVWGPGGGSGADTRLADLADAVGQMRTVEARLTGGFRYGPLRAPLRSGGSAAPMDNWTLYAAAGRIREQALQEPSAPNLHGLGMAHLVLGNYDEAIQAFEDAIAETPQNPRYQSDLAAAYLARAKEQQRPDDVPRALAAAERAIAAEDILEARFNRALALQALYLEDQARQAWDEYLSRDSASEWAEDARRHLAVLQRSENARNDPARNNSPPLIDDTTVEAGLDWMLRQGLPAWADAILARDFSTATRTHTELRDYGQRLTDRAGDPFAVALTTLPQADNPAAVGQATAVRALSRALGLVDEDNLPEAEKALMAGCSEAREPLSWLCDLELGTLDALRRNDATARARVAHVESRAAAQGALYAQARAGPSQRLSRALQRRLRVGAPRVSAGVRLRRAGQVQGPGRHHGDAAVGRLRCHRPPARCVAVADSGAAGHDIAGVEGGSLSGLDLDRECVVARIQLRSGACVSGPRVREQRNPVAAAARAAAAQSDARRARKERRQRRHRSARRHVADPCGLDRLSRRAIEVRSPGAQSDARLVRA